MDSDESVHSESEFYYPEEETPNETTRKKSKQTEKINRLFTGLGRSVWEKTGRT